MTDPVFVQPLPDDISIGDAIPLTGAEARHAEVKRIADGETVIVSDGACRAVRGARSAAGVQVAEILEVPHPRPRVTVVQAIPKFDRAELAVDLMVQVGADRIIPWAAQRCIAKWDGKEAKAHAKWEKTAIAAAKQSRRLRVPEVTSLIRNLSELRSLIGGQAKIAALHEDADYSCKEFISRWRDSQDTSGDELSDIVLLIGPEGGISPDELEQVHEMGGSAIVLGPEVLRTATAAAVALGAIGVLTERWNSDSPLRTDS